GRLMGPRCRYAWTVEVAYPLRKAPHEVRGSVIFRRAVIPEAKLWEPASPFLYAGVVELWEGEQRLDQQEITLGLRYFSVGSRGLRLNGKLLTMRGVQRNERDVMEMLHLREKGYNLIVAEHAAASPELWANADNVGLLVLTRVPSTEQAFAGVLKSVA